MSDENNFDLSKIMDAAKQMQETLEQAQEKIKSTEFEVSVGAGAVTLVMGGDYKLKSLKISDDARGHAGLETLLISAFSDAVDKITEELNLWLEKRILENPSKWIWTHDRWK